MESSSGEPEHTTFLVVESEEDPKGKTTKQVSSSAQTAPKTEKKNKKNLRKSSRYYISKQFENDESKRYSTLSSSFSPRFSLRETNSPVKTRIRSSTFSVSSPKSPLGSRSHLALPQPSKNRLSKPKLERQSYYCNLESSFSLSKRRTISYSPRFSKDKEKDVTDENQPNFIYSSEDPDFPFKTHRKMRKCYDILPFNPTDFSQDLMEMSKDRNKVAHNNGFHNPEKKKIRMSKLKRPRKKTAHNVEINHYYKITNKILGKSYFSQVKVGVHKITKKKVAIKIIDKIATAQYSHVIRIEKIAMLQAVKHPHVVVVEDTFNIRQDLVIVMELMERDLYKELVTRKFFTEKDCSAILYQILSALSYLHGMNLVHCDLKLHNIYLKSKPLSGLEIKIGNLGITEFTLGDTPIPSTGFLSCLAPEILMGSGYGPAIDIWACGVLGYILLSGRLPFEFENEVELFGSIVEGNLVFKSPEFDSISKNAKSLIRSLIVKDPDKRLSAKQALEHPFIKSHVPDNPVHEYFIPNLFKLNSLFGKDLIVVED